MPDAKAAATEAAKEAGAEQSLENPKEQEKMQATIRDALENEGIWAKDAEMKKEIAVELLKQTKAMAKKPKAKSSKWATKEGLQQVKKTLTRETLKKLR